MTLGERQVDLLIGIDRAEVRAGREELAAFLVFLPVFIAIVGLQLDRFHLRSLSANTNHGSPASKDVWDSRPRLDVGQDGRAEVIGRTRFGDSFARQAATAS